MKLHLYIDNILCNKVKVEIYYSIRNTFFVVILHICIYIVCPSIFLSDAIEICNEIFIAKKKYSEW